MGSKVQAGKAPCADADREMLSAWIDGELDPAQQQAMLARVQTDLELRSQLEWLHLAGDALRSNEVAACHEPALVERVRQALSAEAAPAGGAGHSVRWYLAAGVTVAAAAATVMLVALPQLRGGVAEPAAPVASLAAVAPEGAAPAAMASASAPVRAAGSARTAGPGRGSPPMDVYFRAHGELAGAGMMPSAVAYIRLSSEPDR